MDYAKQNGAGIERQVMCIVSHMWNQRKVSFLEDEARLVVTRAGSRQS